jgi:Flp pilus assembly secretin CpaC
MSLLINRVAACRFLVLGWIAILLLVSPAALGTPETLSIAVGSSRVMTGRRISKVAISNPKVIDVQPVSTSELLVTALLPGSSRMFIWDKTGRRQYDVTAMVSDTNLQVFANVIQSTINSPSVTASALGGKILLRGEVATEEERRRAEAIATGIYPLVESMLTVRPGVPPETLAAINETLAKRGVTATQMADGKILLSGTLADPAAVAEMQKALEPWSKTAVFVLNIEVKKTAQQQAIEGLNQIGARWGLKASATPDKRVLLEGVVQDKAALADVEALLKNWPGVAIVSQVRLATSTDVKQVLIRAKVVELNRTDLKNIGVDWTKILFSQGSGGQVQAVAGEQPFIIGQAHAGPFPIFGGPPIEQLDAIGARVSALIDENKAHLLSQPSLVTASGTEANILIGGEIPIPVPQSGTGATATITIEYKPYGISLRVLPTVGDNCEVSMVVKPEVSAIDRANGIVISGIVVPGLRTRRAEASVHVPSGCSIAIGGLISRDDVKDVRRIPLLSQIPVLGNFFRSVATDKRDTELLIIVTPEIVQDARPVDLLREQKTDIPPLSTVDPESIGPELPASECLGMKPGG